MQWPTKNASAEGRHRLIFWLLLINKWFLIPSTVIYELILTGSDYPAEVFHYIMPTVIYTVASLILILLLWLAYRREEQIARNPVFAQMTSALTIFSFITDVTFILFMMFMPDPDNILWALFLAPIALILLIPDFKKTSSWAVDVAAGVTLFIVIQGLIGLNEDSNIYPISVARYIPGDIMLCLTGLLFLWVYIRTIRFWINSVNQETEQFSRWHDLWSDLILRFPPEFFVLDQSGGILIASNSARKLLDLPEQGSAEWPEQTQSIRNALLLRFHSETDIEKTITIPDDTLPNPIKIFPTFFAYEEKRYCIALVQEENPEIPASATILRSDRLTIAGQIAAGLAHEIGNPLGVIQSCAAYLIQKIPEDDPNREEYALIQEETKRCQNLIDRLLSLASPKRDTPGMHDLRTILEHAFSLVKYQAAERNIEFALPKQPVYIYANEGQLSAVFVNLFLNALQSMEDAPLNARLRIQLRTRGKEAIIDITDEGLGIAKEDLEKIFDPFFTKKASGTGLGLSIVHQIIRSMDGRIDVASVEGAGTTFTVYLPLYEMDEEE